MASLESGVPPGEDRRTTNQDSQEYWQESGKSDEPWNRSWVREETDIQRTLRDHWPGGLEVKEQCLTKGHSQKGFTVSGE